MFVLNDVTKDARVLKEAASLVAAGHVVTIMGLLPADSALPELEERPEGFTIMRTPYPTGRESWRPHPQFFHLTYKRLKALAPKAKARAARRRRLLVAAARRLRYRAARRATLILAAVGKLRRRVIRRRTLLLATVRRLRYRAVRRRTLLLAETRKVRTRGARNIVNRQRSGTVRRHRVNSRLLKGHREPGPRSHDPGTHARRRGSDHRRFVATAGARAVLPGRGGRSPARHIRDAVDSTRRRTGSLHASVRPELIRTRVRRWIGGVVTRVSRSSARVVRLLAGLIFVVWSCAYATLHIVTRGHLDWLLRVRYRWDGWGRASAAKAPVADVWHAHDLSGLFGAMRARERNGAPVVYDSHEIILESSSFVLRPRWARWFLGRVERRWASEVAALVTVNDMLARELGRRLEPSTTVVVHNCPPAPESVETASVDLLRTAAGVPPGTPVALYHGGLMVHRGCEQLAQALLEPGLEHVHAVLLGYGGQRDAFVELSRDRTYGGRLHVLDAVPPEQLLKWITTADVAVMPIQASTLNHRMSTPNKLFEAIGAGVPVVGSDFEGFREVVYDNPSGPLGVLCDPGDVRAIGRSILEILNLPRRDRAELRARCLEAARRRWNWQREVRALTSLYAELARAGTEVSATRSVRSGRLATAELRSFAAAVPDDDRQPQSGRSTDPTPADPGRALSGAGRRTTA